MSSRGRQRKHDAPRACAVCGCTDITPCFEPGLGGAVRCAWVEPDLCSACVTTDVAYDLRAGGYHELAERVIAAGLKLPMVALATEGELNELLSATRGLPCARKAGA
jgi:hypothetical protein